MIKKVLKCLVVSLIFVSCIEDYDIENIIGGSDYVVIEANLFSHDSVHYVYVNATEGNNDNFVLNEVSVRLEDENGVVRQYIDVSTRNAMSYRDSIYNDSLISICHMLSEEISELKYIEFEKKSNTEIYKRYKYQIDSLYSLTIDEDGFLICDENGDIDYSISKKIDYLIEASDDYLYNTPLIREISEKYDSLSQRIHYYSHETKGYEFRLEDNTIEAGHTYKLTVCVGDKEYMAEQYMRPLLETFKLSFYKDYSTEGGEKYEYLMPMMFFEDQNPNEKDYYAYNNTAGGYGTRLQTISMNIGTFSDENMLSSVGGMILPLNFRVAPPDEKFNSHLSVGSSYYFEFYSISKENFDYYNALGNQLASDGGVYQPNPPTPVTNFSGYHVQGQFVVADKQVYTGWIKEEDVINE